MRQLATILIFTLMATTYAVKFLDYAQISDSEDLMPLQDDLGNQLYLASEDAQTCIPKFNQFLKADLLDIDYQKETDLFSADQLSKNIQDFNLIQQIPELELESIGEQKDEFSGLEKDLEASGDCIILYSQCSFKGFAKKTCDNPEQALSFELPIQSIFVPDGQMITIYDQKELVSHAFMQSVECLKTAITLSFVPSDVIFSHNSGNAFQITETSTGENQNTDQNVQYQSVTAKLQTEEQTNQQNLTPGSVPKLEHNSEVKQADITPVEQGEQTSNEAKTEEVKQEEEATSKETSNQESSEQNSEVSTQEIKAVDTPAEATSHQEGQIEGEKNQVIDTLSETEKNNAQPEIQW